MVVFQRCLMPPVTVNYIKIWTAMKVHTINLGAHLWSCTDNFLGLPGRSVSTGKVIHFPLQKNHTIFLLHHSKTRRMRKYLTIFLMPVKCVLKMQWGNWQLPSLDTVFTDNPSIDPLLQITDLKGHRGIMTPLEHAYYELEKLWIDGLRE